MKQKLFVPVMGSVFHQYPEQTLRDLKAAGADQVFYACGFPYAVGEKEQMLAWVKSDLAQLKAKGVEPCVWINAFGFGGPFPSVTEKLTDAKVWSKKEGFSSPKSLPAPSGLSDT